MESDIRKRIEHLLTGVTPSSAETSLTISRAQLVIRRFLISHTAPGAGLGSHETSVPKLNFAAA